MVRPNGLCPQGKALEATSCIFRICMLWCMLHWTQYHVHIVEEPRLPRTRFACSTSNGLTLGLGLMGQYISNTPWKSNLNFFQSHGHSQINLKKNVKSRTLEIILVIFMVIILWSCFHFFFIICWWRTRSVIKLFLHFSLLGFKYYILIELNAWHRMLGGWILEDCQWVLVVGLFAMW